VGPLWRLSASKLAVTADIEVTYDVKAIPLSSIVLVTSRTVKIDIDMIIDKQRISFMNEAVSLLRGILDEWTRREARVDGDAEIPEVDWGRMRQLEFQEALRSREAIGKRLVGKGCVLCEQFEEHVRYLGPFHS
jgi:antiviral helicase SKI2